MRIELKSVEQQVKRKKVMTDRLIGGEERWRARKGGSRSIPGIFEQLVPHQLLSLLQQYIFSLPFLPSATSLLFHFLSFISSQSLFVSANTSLNYMMGWDGINCYNNSRLFFTLDHAVTLLQIQVIMGFNKGEKTIIG